MSCQLRVKGGVTTFQSPQRTRQERLDKFFTKTLRYDELAVGYATVRDVRAVLIPYQLQGIPLLYCHRQRAAEIDAYHMRAAGFDPHARPYTSQGKSVKHSCKAMIFFIA